MKLVRIIQNKVRSIGQWTSPNSEKGSKIDSSTNYRKSELEGEGRYLERSEVLVFACFTFVPLLAWRRLLFWSFYSSE